MVISPLRFIVSENYQQALERAADLWGIERQYWDIWGNQHHATEEGMVAALSSMGVPTETREQLDDAVESALVEQWTRAIPHTLVLSVNQPVIPVRVPSSAASGTVTVTVEYEDGKHSTHSVDLGTVAVSASADLRGVEYVEKPLALPIEPRLGYHTLAVEGPGIVPAFGDLILCPDRAYMPESLSGNKRAAGIAVSLYGLRSARNWGCGDFTDLKVLCRWTAHELNASFVALNPLHAIPNRQPYNTSPYLPACAFYKNFLYIDVSAVPGYESYAWARRIAGSAAVQDEVARLRDSEYVEYEAIARLKLRFLKVLFRDFLRGYRANTPETQSFREYVASQGDLLDYWAVYCALDEHLHKADRNVWLWTDWPEAYRNPRSEQTREFAKKHWRSVLFYKFIQWQAGLQLEAAQEAAKAEGMSIGLYHDLALATDRFGADLWAHRRFYVEGCRVGAPPDDFSPNGQDWSFPPPDSRAHFEDGYRLFAESIRKNLQHGGALRIDHVMRFFHLFWIPGSLGDARRGIYVKDRHEDLIRILALESVRNQTLIVGEDLGTVSDEVRDTLRRFGILSYRLFYFEKQGDGRMRLPHDYPAQAIVSTSTHDLATLSGFWSCRDIEARRTAGIYRDDGDYQKQLNDRATDKQRMLDVLFTLGLMPKDGSRSALDYPELTGEIHNAIVGFLAGTPSKLMVLLEEDLMKQPDQQNLPGTTAEYPNWRHKTLYPIEEWGQGIALDYAHMYRGWLNVSGRLNR